MHRAQLLLEDWQYETLKSLSVKKQKSISSVIRNILTKFLAPKKSSSKNSIRELQGIIKDSALVGKNHDLYLYGPEK